MEQTNRQIDQSYLDQFNSMQRSGALADLDALRNENRILDTLINDAAKLYALRSVEDIMAFVIDRVLQQFIPTHFLVLFDRPRGGGTVQYSYVNMKPSDALLSQAAYDETKAHFVGSPYPADFADIEVAGARREELSRFDPAIVVPLCGIEGVYGIAVLGAKVVGSDYTPVERMYIDKFSRFVSIGIQNNLHHESAITDAKTGLYNHAYFMQRLGQEIAHVARHGAKAGLIMLDIDHFKNFNDTWGHLAGDEVLLSLSATLKGVVRIEDVASRFGGEEFCVLAIECDAPRLREMCERIRLAIEDMRVPYKDARLAVTASLGCCCLDPELHIGPESYIDMADRALYISKANGRNQSTLYRPRLLDRAREIRDRGE